MTNTKNLQEYNCNEVAKKLKISVYTLNNWYRWESKELSEGIVDKPYLPQPRFDTTSQGRPRLWNSEQVKLLSEHKKLVITGRHGKYGKYTNPNYNPNKKSLTN